MNSKKASGGQTKEDRLLLAQLEDKIELAERRSMITRGDFLDPHQRRLAEEYCRHRGAGVRIVFYGGYAEAERCMPVFIPDFIPEDVQEEELGELLRVIRACLPGAKPRKADQNGMRTEEAHSSQTHSSRNPGVRTPGHRDYLGSLLALGIDRNVTGDILVRDGTSDLGPGADIIVEAEIAEFIAMNYTSAGRAELHPEVLPVTDLHIEPVSLEARSDTVASLRLDNIVASAFRLSRAKAGEAIRRGLVSVNSAEALKPDSEIREGDRIVLRGQGKVILSEIGGATRKDRTRITLLAYRK